MAIVVRPLEDRDEGSWRKLWSGYLDFYGVPDLPKRVTDNTWSMLRRSDQADVFGLVAEYEGRVKGMVNCIIHANTWLEEPVCYLEDLFVEGAARSLGLGKALIKGAADMAHAMGCARIYWRTKPTNVSAMAIYGQIADKTDWVTYQIDLKAWR